MQRRIHIVGCTPRTGTTLMTELVVNGFKVDGFTEHELSIFTRPREQFDIFCSKSPQDILAIRPLLAIDRQLWAIYMLRDPRDVVVSKHGRSSSKYWANLRMWREYHRAARKVAHHPRFLTVRYSVHGSAACQRSAMLLIAHLACPLIVHHELESCRFGRGCG